jgi:hypothetical protein
MDHCNASWVFKNVAIVWISQNLLTLPAHPQHQAEESLKPPSDLNNQPARILSN